MRVRRAVLVGLLAVMATCFVGCAEPVAGLDRGPLSGSWSPGPRTGGARLADDALVRNVVLVTIDGVRWQEVFGGVDPRLAEGARLPRSTFTSTRELLPNIHRLFFEGGTVLGDPRLPGGFRASGPRFVSLPGYLELMTGAPSGCVANDCDFELTPTIADDVGSAVPAGQRPHAAAVFASWEVIGKVASTDPGSVVVRAGRQPGDDAPAYPGHGGYRPDHVTQVEAVAHLLAHRPRLLWIGLGDPDEWAHRKNYRGYLESLRSADTFIGELAAHLADMGEHGARTALIVTTDHGRDDSFDGHGGAESGAGWLLVRGESLPKRGAVGTRGARHLRDVAPTIRAMMGLGSRSCPGCGAAITEVLPDTAEAPLVSNGVERAPRAMDPGGPSGPVAPDPG